jgi:hypothetical protein
MPAGGGRTALKKGGNYLFSALVIPMFMGG